MCPRPPRRTRPHTLFPFTTLFRSPAGRCGRDGCARRSPAPHRRRDGARRAARGRGLRGSRRARSPPRPRSRRRRSLSPVPRVRTAVSPRRPAVSCRRTFPSPVLFSFASLLLPPPLPLLPFFFSFLFSLFFSPFFLFFL